MLAEGNNKSIIVMKIYLPKGSLGAKLKTFKKTWSSGFLWCLKSYLET